MAEMLVRIADKTSDDVHKNAMLTKRGDVIVIMSDGWTWSAAERAGDPWVIVKVPGVDPSLLTGFIADDPDDGTAKIRQRRAFGFNLTAYQKSPALAKGLTLQQALAFKVGKPNIPDPNVL